MHTLTVLLLSVLLLLSTAHQALSAPIPISKSLENTQIRIDWAELDKKYNDCLMHMMQEGESVSFSITDCARQNTPSMRVSENLPMLLEGTGAKE